MPFTHVSHKCNFSPYVNEQLFKNGTFKSTYFQWRGVESQDFSENVFYSCFTKWIISSYVNENSYSKVGLSIKRCQKSDFLTKCLLLMFNINGTYGNEESYSKMGLSMKRCRKSDFSANVFYSCLTNGTLWMKLF